MNQKLARALLLLTLTTAPILASASAAFAASNATATDYSLPPCERIFFTNADDKKKVEEYQKKIQEEGIKAVDESDIDKAGGRYEDCKSRTNADGFTGEGSNVDPNSPVPAERWNDPMQPGRFKDSTYDFSYNDGFGLSEMGNIDNVIWGGITNIIWGANVIIIKLALWLLGYAYRFPLLTTLAKWTGEFAQEYEYRYVAGLSMRYWALSATLIYAAFHIMRGRLGKGIGEIFTTFVVFVVMMLAVSVNGGPAGILKGGFTLAGSFAGSTLSLGASAKNNPIDGKPFSSNARSDWWIQGLNYEDKAQFAEYLHAKCSAVAGMSGRAFNQEQRAAEIKENFTANGKKINQALEQTYTDYMKNLPVMMCPIRAQIFFTFVEAPHQFLSWGRNLKDACAKIRDNGLATGGWGTDWGVRMAMEGKDSDGRQLNEQNTLSDAGGTQELKTNCAANGVGAELFRYNRDATFGRFFYAVLTLISSIFVVILLVTLTFGVLAAQATAALLLAFAPVAISGGLLPGSGRQIMIRWAMAVFKCFMAVVALATFLTTYVLAINAILNATFHVPLLERFVALFAIILVLGLNRKKLSQLGGQVTNAAAGVLSNSAIGGATGGGRGGGGGGGGSFGAMLGGQNPSAALPLSLDSARGGVANWKQKTMLGQMHANGGFTRRANMQERQAAKGRLGDINAQLKDMSAEDPARQALEKQRDLVQKQASIGFAGSNFIPGMAQFNQYRLAKQGGKAAAAGGEVALIKQKQSEETKEKRHKELVAAFRSAGAASSSPDSA